jgi:hypothetical protein
MIFYVRKWQLRVSPDGRRQIDLHMVPIGGDAIEISDWDSTQRRFLADPDSKLAERLQERLRNSDVGPQICGVDCAINEDTEYPISDAIEWDQDDTATMKRKRPLGSADPTTANIKLSASTRLVEELIRQDGLGRKIYYIELDIDGLERATGTNNEGGLVGYTWQARARNGEPLYCAVNAYRLHYNHSPTYDPPSQPQEPLLLRSEALTIGQTIVQLLKQITSIERYIIGLSVMLMIVIVIIWRR